MNAVTLRLFVTSPGHPERVYDVMRPGVVVGRDAEVEIPIGDRTLSRRHCRIYYAPDGWRVTDLGSRNGTYVRGALILDERLKEGDSIELGESRITARGIEEDGEEAANATLTQLLLDHDAKKESRSQKSELRREIRALTHLMEMNEKINALSDEDRLLGGILDAAIQLTGAGRGFLLLRQEDHLTVRRARLPDRTDLAGADASLSVSIARHVIERGASVLAENAQTDARFAENASVANLELRSIVCVPMKGRDEVLGAIYLDNVLEAGTFDGWDVRILETFASLASIAIRRARQRREMGQRRREAVRQARRIERLNERLKKALRIRTNALRQAREDLAKQADELGLKYDYAQIIGRSPAMQRVLRLVDRVTDLKIPVLIVGESGTGKELIARAIHFNGPRRRGRIVSENCSAIPETLMESEFFGFKRGAFTGATRDQAGLFEQADGGTLFLDEVGELAPELQSKFLRVLEEGAVRRLGAKTLTPVDVRVVAATNRDLHELLSSGGFREDLYYRLAGVVVELPPLRERREDVPALVAHFLRELGGGESGLRIEPAAMELLQAYEWPGNVRELRNEVHRVVALQAGGEIRPEHLSPRLLQWRPPDLEVPPEGGLRALVEDLERRVLRASLLRHGWNKSRASAELGLSRLGLRKKLERYGIDAEQPR